MTQPQPPEAKSPSEVVRQRVRALREGRGWSGVRLAQEMTAVGVKWDRSIVANFENGRRATVTIEELLALAYVLDVAPVHLLVPVDESWYLFVPEAAAYAGRVREWVRGNYWMPRFGGDERRYYTDVPADEWAPPWPRTDEEREQRDRQRREENAERTAQLAALVEAGDPRVEYHPGTGPGTDSYTVRPFRRKKEDHRDETGADPQDRA